MTELLALKNGSLEPESAVNKTMMSLEKLWSEGTLGAFAVYDLYELCRNPNHKIGNNALNRLLALELIQADGRVRESIKNIVLSAVTGGSPLNIKMGSPVKQAALS